MVNMDTQEDQNVEPPHCVGCENYSVKKRDGDRPKELCKIARMIINNGYIARRSRERCPKGRGTYGESGHRSAELRGEWVSVPMPDRLGGGLGYLSDVYPRGEEACPRMVSPERADPRVGYGQDSLRARRDVAINLGEAVRRVEEDHRLRGMPVPDGCRVEIPYIHQSPNWSPIWDPPAAAQCTVRTARATYSTIRGWSLED